MGMLVEVMGMSVADILIGAWWKQEEGRLSNSI